MARRPITWSRIRDPFYASLGAAIIVTQIISNHWNPLACGVALALFGLPGIIALNEWGGKPRDGSGPTPSSSDGSPSAGSSSPSSGHPGGDRHDESA